jgi:hypothetical protein
MTSFYHQAVRLGTIAFLALTSSLGLFAQTSVVLDPACQSCPPSATLNANAATPVPTPVPSCGTVAGTYAVGTALTAANTITLSLNVVTVGAYSITTTATNGMTFTGSGTFAATGAQNVVLTGSGTPTLGGATNILIQYGSTNCAATVNVTGGIPPLDTRSKTLSYYGGTLSGKTCFDIALTDNISCSTLASRLPSQSDFDVNSHRTQTYTFTPGNTVSNVRFYFENTNGNVILSITGGNSGNSITTAVTAVAKYNTALNTLALGLTNSNPLTANIYAVYNINPINNNNPNDDRMVQLTARVKDCMCCGAWMFANIPENQGNVAMPVTATKVWKNFMCHNLGADTNTDPLTNASGKNSSIFQWGRPADGHQLATAPTGSVSTILHPIYGPFNNILYPAGVAVDWVKNSNSNTTYKDWNNFALWGDGNVFRPTEIKGPNDPCPSGYRVLNILDIHRMAIGSDPFATNIGGPGSLLTLTNTASGQLGNSPINQWFLFNTGGMKVGDYLFFPSMSPTTRLPTATNDDADWNYWLASINAYSTTAGNAKHMNYFSGAVYSDRGTGFPRTKALMVRCVEQN